MISIGSIFENIIINVSVSQLVKVCLLSSLNKPLEVYNMGILKLTMWWILILHIGYSIIIIFLLHAYLLNKIIKCAKQSLHNEQ